jgi:CheY-like chemotaxis protein
MMRDGTQLWFNSGKTDSVSPGSSHDKKTSVAPIGRVLIVEDELFVAWHLESLASEFGLDVVGLVPDGESAIEQSGDAAPDLVFMDINLAGQIDGVETASRIRAQRDVALIFITAFADEATLGRIRKAVPAAQVLTKPVSSDRLNQAVRIALSPRAQ